MNLRMILTAAAAVGLAAAAHAAPPAAQATTPAPAKGMNYDCTKAGNKNKAACKNVTQGGVAASQAGRQARCPHGGGQARGPGQDADEL